MEDIMQALNLRTSRTPLPNAAAMVAGPVVMLASYLIHTGVDGGGPGISMDAVRKMLAAVAAHRVGALTGFALWGVAAALLIPAFAGLRAERAKGERLVAVGVPFAQVGLIAATAVSALLGLVPHVLTAPGGGQGGPVGAAQVMHALNDAMTPLYLAGLLFPLGTVILTIGLLRDPAVRWRAIPLGVGAIPTLFIFSGLPGIIAAALMLTGFVWVGLRPGRATARSAAMQAPVPAA
jgi:hypothetical protein